MNSRGLLYSEAPAPIFKFIGTAHAMAQLPSPQDDGTPYYDSHSPLRQINSTRRLLHDGTGGLAHIPRFTLRGAASHRRVTHGSPQLMHQILSDFQATFEWSIEVDDDEEYHGK